MSEVRPWPEGVEEHHSTVVRLFEQTLEGATQTGEELSENAREMRDYAAHTDIPGHREAALALADRYEQAATVRLVERTELSA